MLNPAPANAPAPASQSVGWRNTCLLAVFCVFFSAANVACAEEPLPSLQWKFQAGQAYEFVITQNSTTEIDVAGNKTLQPEAKRLILRWEILAVTEQGFESELRYQEIDLEVGAAAGKVSVSTNPQTPQIGSGRAATLLRGLLGRLNPLIDQPIRLQMDLQGRVTAVELSPELQAHLQATPETRPLREAVTANGIQQLLAGFLTPLPATPTALWEDRRTYEVAAGLPLTQTTRYSLGPWSEPNPTVDVNFTSDLTFPEQYLLGATRPDDPEASPARDPNPPKNAPAPFDFDPISKKWPRIAQQDSGGRIVFDVQAGYVRQAAAKTLIVTEKAYSDAKIKTTISTQTQVEVRRL